MITSALKAGVEKFCQEHPETSFVYDIKHKTAAVLKRELARDETWLEFTRLAARTKNRVQQTSLAYLAPPNQRSKARPEERLLGSSEVLESILGKLKRLEQDQAKSGFTGLLLSIGAMVSSTTSDVILEALEGVPTKKVLAWCKETLDRSVQAKRQRALTSHGKSEQKRDQAWATI